MKQGGVEVSDQLRQIRVEGLPAPMGHYSDAVLAGNTLYTAATAHDQSGAVQGVGDVAEQSRAMFENLGRVLAAVGCEPGDVAKVTVYMVDVNERAKMNAARKEFFGEHRPASALVGVNALVHPDVLIEVDAVAVLPSR
jgi:2-iminobutanoate/2-iminopropanoate deaminase